MEIFKMRVALVLLALGTLAGCSWEKMAHYSPYDLNRDGVMDAVCPGMDYDTSDYRHYSWRPVGSDDCAEQVNNQNQAAS
jgi:hypothetical protein